LNLIFIIENQYKTQQNQNKNNNFKLNFGPMDMPHKAQPNNNIIIRSYEPTFLVCTFQAKNSPPLPTLFFARVPLKKNQKDKKKTPKFSFIPQKFGIKTTIKNIK
jgi:hypothetical protein